MLRAAHALLNVGSCSSFNCIDRGIDPNCRERIWPAVFSGTLKRPETSWRRFLATWPRRQQQ